MQLDFFKIKHRVTEKRNGLFIDVYPEFLVKRSNDLFIRGGKFYAVLNKDTGFWDTNEYVVQEYVDEELKKYTNTNSDIQKKKAACKHEDEFHLNIMEMINNRSRSWIEYKTYVNNLPDNYHQLDDKICFDVETVNPKDYISKKLPYKLEEGPYDAWEKLVGTLYKPEEKEKIEWAIGSIINGASKEIQKFIVLYGAPGAGKGTILNIIQKLFPGYYEVFDAKSLSSNTNNFAFEQFRSNPLIALQMDGDLSRVEDNTKLNSLISHETILMNEKRKQSYNFKPRCFLFMASNKAVDITDSKSGLLRRIIEVDPSGTTLPKREYDQLMNQIDFQLSGIAWHCLDVFNQLGKNHYNGYKPYAMMERTNALYNFVIDRFEELNSEDGISVAGAFEIWERYCEEIGMKNYMKRPSFKEQLKDYFVDYEEYKKVNGKSVRDWLTHIDISKLKSGFKGQKVIQHTDPSFGLVLDQKKSLLDDILKDCQAQYAEDDGHGGSKPILPWDKVTTTLKDLDTTKLHFVRLPKNHIVIDFDLKNVKGEKDAVLNLEAADGWPKTYAEFSQGGKGVHLHYIYDGDPEELAPIYAKDIEIKVYKGKSSLRRRLSSCNNIEVKTIKNGLPKKEVKDQLIDFESAKDEKHIRNIIAKCLKKDIAQPYTAPAISLIKKTLDDAYDAGVKYDVRDLRPSISAFAAKSSHQKDICMKVALDLKYFSKHYDEEHKWDGSLAEEKTVKPAPEEKIVEARPITKPISEKLVFFDIEVFPNLLLVVTKEEGRDCVPLYNPSREDIGRLLHYKLVGFNCRRYDNHILYARYMGYDNDAIYRLSQRIIEGSKNAMFGQAYNLSYTDVYDFAAKKQSLKKWEIELEIHHQELGLPWDKPVPEERWKEVADYCFNDVIATEAVFRHLAGDFKAREILADIAGMCVNDTTNMLTTRIIFGDDPNPQRQFNYPDLAKKFPGYKFENGKSTLNGVEIGEGGRVYAVPGIYRNVVTYDVASMHPSSIIAENGFGKYTERFKQLMDIRVAIKHKDFDAAKKMLDGKLAKYLTNKDEAKALSQALKIAINSVYGLTAAGFDNKFRDPRNKDNWVAKRGALFMEDLRLRVQALGATVVHIKTDSIKIENPTEKVTDYILSRGKEYGYTFEVEDIYEKICLVNDAVYIALRDKTDPGWIDECEKAKKDGKGKPTRWTATGAQFQHPYVFKKLFSHEDIVFRDLCETKTVTSALYLDLNENLTDVSIEEKERDKLTSRIKKLEKIYPDESKENQEKIKEEVADLRKDTEVLDEIIAKGHNYIFIGKAGSFCPVKNGQNGGILCREKDGKFYSATGAKGYRWREGESLNGADRLDMIDMGYFEELAKTAREAVEAYGPFEEFASETPARSKPAFSSSKESLTIDEVLDRSDRMFAKTPPPPFDDESILQSQKELKSLVEN